MRIRAIFAGAVLLWTALPAFAPAAQAAPASASTQIVYGTTLRPSTHPLRLSRALIALPVTYTYNGVRHTLDDFLARSLAQGFVVLHGTTIVNERYSLADRSTWFQSWSMAKSFTSAAVGIALHEGYFHSIDDPVTRYVPQLKGSGYDNVSLRNLLRMSSGVQWNETTDDIWMQAGVYAGASLKQTVETRVRAVAPGTAFNYTSPNTFVLAWAVSNATHRPYAQYVQQKIWGPAGMESRAFVESDSGGAALGYCCYFATDRDYARFGLLYLNRGRASGHQVIPAAWITASSHASAPFNAPSSDTGLGYGLGWWVGGGDRGDYTASGLGGQFIYVSPKDDVVIVKSATFSPTTDTEALAAFRATATYVTTHP